MSGSDDKSVMCWDIATGQNLTTFKEHEVNLPMDMKCIKLTASTTLLIIADYSTYMVKSNFECKILWKNVLFFKG